MKIKLEVSAAVILEGNELPETLTALRNLSRPGKELQALTQGLEKVAHAHDVVRDIERDLNNGPLHVGEPAPW